MTIPQQFSLRWNNYSQHIVSALEDLRSDDEFTDVTLSCEGERLKAHKILLSACSTYFRDTFRENPLRFMYNGQVNVSQERLPSFLQTAELLQIKGLTDMNEKEDTAKKRNGSASTSSQNLPSNVDSNSRSATPDVPPRPPTPKRKRIIVGGYPNDGASSSGNISFSSSSAVSTQPIVVASSSNGPSTSGGGLLNPQSVVIPSTSSIQVNEEEFQDVSIVKYEDDDTQEQEDEYEEKHMSSDNDNSAHDMLCNVEPGSIGVFGGNGPSGMNATGVESSSHEYAETGVLELEEQLIEVDEEELIIPMDSFHFIPYTFQMISSTPTPAPPQPVSRKKLSSSKNESGGKPSTSFQIQPALPKSTRKRKEQLQPLQQPLSPPALTIAPGFDLTDLAASGSGGSFDDLWYPCPHCDKRYKCRSSLDSHQKIHSGLENTCFCGVTMSRARDLKRHMTTVHRDILNSSVGGFGQNFNFKEENSGNRNCDSANENSN